MEKQLIDATSSKAGEGRDWRRHKNHVSLHICRKWKVMCNINLILTRTKTEKAKKKETHKDLITIRKVIYFWFSSQDLWLLWMPKKNCRRSWSEVKSSHESKHWACSISKAVNLVWKPIEPRFQVKSSNHGRFIFSFSTSTSLWLRNALNLFARCALQVVLIFEMFFYALSVLLLRNYQQHIRVPSSLHGEGSRTRWGASFAIRRR